MEAVPAVSSSVERSSQNPLISLAPRLYTISHPNKCSKLENDEISGLTLSVDSSKRLDHFLEKLNGASTNRRKRAYAQSSSPLFVARKSFFGELEKRLSDLAEAI